MIDAREYLHSFRIADSKIQLKIQQVQKLNDRLLSLTAPMDKEQVSHTKTWESWLKRLRQSSIRKMKLIGKTVN